MRRVRRPTELPLLKTALAGFRGLPAGQTQTYALLQALRELTERLRGGEAQPFYSTREVAAFFGVPQPTVVQVYRELETEGLLVRLRSIGTLLQPRRRQPRVPVRGIVGLPVWQWGYCHLPEWRRFFVQIEEHLARHHLVADFIFFSSEITDQERFLERLLQHNLDYVFWYKPLPTYKSMLLSLQDGGVQVAVLMDTNARLPFPTYRQDYEPGMLQALRVWQRAGLREVVILQGGGSGTLTPMLLTWLERVGLRGQVWTIGAAELPRVVTKLRRTPDTGVLLCDDALNSQLSSVYWHAMSDLFSQNRVLLSTLLNCDPLSFRSRRVDVLHINWDKITARIADDLASGRSRTQKETVVFPAKLHLHADAALFAHPY